jgi:hypothetical protein
MAAGTDGPSLEERVAALEATVAMLMDKSLAGGDITVNDVRAALGYEPLKAYIPSWTPLTEAEEPLTPDEIRKLLRECVTVVKPGETLILRVPWSTTPSQVRDLQDAITGSVKYWDLPFKVLVVPGDELTVAEPDGIPGAA